MKIKFSATEFINIYSKKGTTKNVALHACNCCKGCKAGKC